jgi:hypothetical protein
MTAKVLPKEPVDRLDGPLVRTAAEVAPIDEQTNPVDKAIESAASMAVLVKRNLPHSLMTTLRVERAAYPAMIPRFSPLATVATL